MSFATNMIATARRLIQTYGESITLQRVAEGAYVPTTGAVGAATTTNYTAYGAPVDYNQAEVDGATIRTTDIKLWLELPTTVTPLVGDTATFNSVTHRVITVEKLRAQGSEIVYVLQLRV